MAQWNQVELTRWDDADGRRQAVAVFGKVASEPPFNELEFSYPEDEDGFGFAIVLTPSGMLGALVDDIGVPIGGTHLWMTGDGDPELLVSEVIEMAGLHRDDIVWASERLPKKP